MIVNWQHTSANVQAGLYGVMEAQDRNGGEKDLQDPKCNRLLGPRRGSIPRALITIVPNNGALLV